MSLRKEVKFAITMALAISAMACAKDPTVPASAEDQAKLMRGSAPSADQLSQAMKNYHGLGGAPKGTTTPPKPDDAPKH